VMLREVGFDEFTPLPRHAGVSAFLIKLHKAAVAGDISRDDCRKASHRSVGRLRTVLSAAYRMKRAAGSIGVAHWQIPRTYPQRL
jgi:hypothetical protein